LSIQPGRNKDDETTFDIYYIASFPPVPQLLLGTSSGGLKLLIERRAQQFRKCGIRGCTGYVPAHRTMADGMLCDEHYAPVSDDVINAWIRKRLGEGGTI
jgi:hypothetical protein